MSLIAVYMRGFSSIGKLLCSPAAQRFLAGAGKVLASAVVSRMFADKKVVTPSKEDIDWDNPDWEKLFARKTPTREPGWGSGGPMTSAYYVDRSEC